MFTCSYKTTYTKAYAFSYIWCTGSRGWICIKSGSSKSLYYDLPSPLFIEELRHFQHSKFFLNYTIACVRPAPCKSCMRGGSPFPPCLDGLFFSERTCGFFGVALIKSAACLSSLFPPNWPLNKSSHYAFPEIVTLCTEWKIFFLAFELDLFPRSSLERLQPFL